MSRTFKKARSWPLMIGITVMILLLTPVAGFAAGEVEEDELEMEADREAPMLAALVQAGELPPVDERLPENPRVIEPWEEIGRHGGEARSALIGPADDVWLSRTVQFGGLLGYDYDFNEIVTDMAANFEANDEATEFTIELRKGHRWSDGEPFTTADIEWWYENVALNEELSPVPPGVLTGPDDDFAELHVIDETTVRFAFSQPNPLFWDSLAAFSGATLATPRHYASQFHADFNDDVHEIAEAEGYDTWTDYFYAKMELPENPDLPTLYAWKVVEGAEYTGEHPEVRYERNPYFYQVDPEGNQLPYIDSWVFDMLEDSEVLLLRAMAGEVDLIHRHINTVENRPVLTDNQERGGYRLYYANPTLSNAMAISLNMTHEDEVFREIARNRDFRVGLSHAIDREELSDLVFAGMAEPRQAAPLEAMGFYHEEFAKQYTEYDPELANEYFDRAGFELDDDGRRLGPDGQPITFGVDIHSAGTDNINMMEIIQSHWRDVGIDVELNVMDRSLQWERFPANEHEATVWAVGAGMRDALVDMRQYIPIDHIAGRFGPRWAAWYGAGSVLEAGVEPEEPPETVQRALRLYDQLQVASPDEMNDIAYQIFDAAAEGFWRIGTLSAVQNFGVASNRVRNIPDRPIPYAVIYHTPGPMPLTQLYIRDGD